MESQNEIMYKASGKYNGEKFGMLTVLGDAARKRLNDRSEIMLLCDCVCGNKVEVSIRSLRSGNTKSCGCIQKIGIVKHGLSKHPLFRRWLYMNRRCTDKRSGYYQNYGGRGITVCDEWKVDPTRFIEWGMSNGFQEELELDRINVNGNYEPGNCRFVTKSVNALNKRTSKQNRVAVL